MTDNEAYRVSRLYFEGRITRDDEKALYTYIRQDETPLASFANGKKKGKRCTRIAKAHTRHGED